MQKIDPARPEFTDRETYLAWRAAWRARWRALTLEIREHKRLRKESAWPAERRDEAYRHQCAAASKRNDARRLLKIRGEAKEKGMALRAAARAVRSAAAAA